MRRLSILFIVFAIVGACFFVALDLYSSSPSKSIIGNPAILAEINRLLLPVFKQTIRESDFSTLKILVAGDAIARDEVHELEVLALYQEYAHVGHGLGSLYQYIRTGLENVCPGHALAHYYVFAKHGETTLANENLRRAHEAVEKNNLNTGMFAETLARVDRGNISVSEDEITELADAECL